MRYIYAGIEYKGRERLPTGSAIPNKDADENPLLFEYGLRYVCDILYCIRYMYCVINLYMCAV